VSGIETGSGTAAGAAALLVVDVGATTTTCSIDGVDVVLPFGAAALTASALRADPPRPEELTNAIGVVVDHLDDLVRDVPAVAGAAVHVRGPEMVAIAAVEVGAAARLPFEIERDAVEEVFRTLATEAARDRRRNPGLDPEQVDTVVGGCCIAVALVRRLHLDRLTVLG